MESPNIIRTFSPGVSDTFSCAVSDTFACAVVRSVAERVSQLKEFIGKQLAQDIVLTLGSHYWRETPEPEAFCPHLTTRSREPQIYKYVTSIEVLATGLTSSDCAKV